MDARNKRAREVMEQIRQVLLHDWDPFGIVHCDCLQDEYDSCIAGIYRLIASGARPDVIAQHLARIECEWAGLPGRMGKELMPVARKLSDLDVRLESG